MNNVILMRLMFVLSFSVLISSCVDKLKPDDLTGRWIASIKNLENDQFSNQKYYFEFQGDGQFSAQIEFWEKSKGTWKLSGDSIFINYNENNLVGTITSHATDSIKHLVLEVSQLNEGKRRLEIDLKKFER